MSTIEEHNSTCKVCSKRTQEELSEVFPWLKVDSAFCMVRDTMDQSKAQRESIIGRILTKYGLTDTLTRLLEKSRNAGEKLGEAIRSWERDDNSELSWAYKSKVKAEEYRDEQRGPLLLFPELFEFSEQETEQWNKMVDSLDSVAADRDLKRMIKFDLSTFDPSNVESPTAQLNTRVVESSSGTTNPSNST